MWKPWAKAEVHSKIYIIQKDRTNLLKMGQSSTLWCLWTTFFYTCPLYTSSNNAVLISPLCSLGYFQNRNFFKACWEKPFTIFSAIWLKGCVNVLFHNLIEDKALKGIPKWTPGWRLAFKVLNYVKLKKNKAVLCWNQKCWLPKNISCPHHVIRLCGLWDMSFSELIFSWQ